MNIFLHFSVLCLLIGFSSCINSTQDAMDVYEFEGDSSAEYYANYGVGDEFLEPVFRDSILPNILKLEFDKLINYYDVLKDTPLHKTFRRGWGS